MSKFCILYVYDLLQKNNSENKYGFFRNQNKKKELKWKMRTYKAKDCLEGNTAQKVITLDRIVYHN